MISGAALQALRLQDRVLERYAWKLSELGAEGIVAE